MTVAELVLVVAGAVGIYLLLRPVQRRLERYLVRKLARPSHDHPPTIDITDFKYSSRSHQKEDEES